VTITLGADFPAASVEQWRRLALAALRKSGNATDETTLDQVDDLLATITYDGLRLPALNTPDGLTAAFPGLFPYARGARAARGLIGGWDVRQRHDGPGPVLEDLENGATSLWLRTDDPAASLDGVFLDAVAVVLDPGDRFLTAAGNWFDLLAARGVDPARTSGGFGADPLGRRAATGDASGLAGALTDAASLAGRCLTTSPGMRAITVDATIYHEAGGSDAEEVGCATAAGVAYLRALTDAGLSVPDALGQLEFRFATTADQFATTAKLRAARRVWARVAEMCEAPAAGGQLQHAVTSAAMMTARDPWVNLLRTTLATFAAGTGGADAITVLPFDHQLGQPDALARRLARNTQTLLIEEAHAARVLDPAGGSWYVERYTDELAQAAWDWFTTIEQAGGLAAALDSGLVADRLATTWSRREADIAHRRAPLTGVSEFPLLDEQLPHRPPTDPSDAAATTPPTDNAGAAAITPPIDGATPPADKPSPPADGRTPSATPLDAPHSVPPTTGSTLAASATPPAGGSTRSLAGSPLDGPSPGAGGGGLPRRRYAEAFERLRDRSDAHLAVTGERPSVSLVLLGSAGSHGARLTFTTNLFAAGGIAVTTEPGSAVVCVCGPDKAYAESASPAAQAAKAGGARRVLLAGRGDYAGVDEYIFTGCDAIAALENTLAELGVQA
jgi:methylmalonyl-CoA mutase